MNYTDCGINIPIGVTGEVRTKCPKCSHTRKQQHQNEKDLAVNVDTGAWTCFHCGWSGALTGGGEKYTRPEYTVKPIHEKVLAYFQKRGIGKETVERCNIGYQEGIGPQPGAIMFPRYKGGQVVAIKYRTHDKRMWQSKNPEPCFYNYDMANTITDKQDVIITEGEIDAMSWIQAGFPNVVSVPDGAPPVGANNLGNKLRFLDDALLDGFKSVILSIDNDVPGKAFEIILADKIGRHRCLRLNYPEGCKDVNDVLIKHGIEGVKNLYENKRLFPVDGLFTVDDVQDAVLSLYQDGLRSGLSTGWKNLNDYYTVRPCELTVLTGIPGSGKSTFIDAMTVNLNRLHGWKFAYCSPENWPIKRHIAGIAEKIIGKPFSIGSWSSDRMSRDELKKVLEKMGKSFYFTELQEKQMSISIILDVMQAAIDRHGVNGIILDPWNELEYHRPSNLSETEYVSESLGKIRRFARLNNVHIWLVAHPTKLKRNDDGTYPVPRLYDISGSAHFYNKADNGIVVHRPNPKKPLVNVHVQKIRFREIGKIGQASLLYVHDSGTYSELKEEHRNYYESSNDGGIPF